MIHEVNVTQKRALEEYYLLRGIRNNGNKKEVIKEKEFQDKPTLDDIATFLNDSRADFVSLETNYRFLTYHGFQL